jgi:hypothetical protein
MFRLLRITGRTYSVLWSPRSTPFCIVINRNCARLGDLCICERHTFVGFDSSLNIGQPQLPFDPNQMVCTGLLVSRPLTSYFKADFNDPTTKIRGNDKLKQKRMDCPSVLSLEGYEVQGSLNPQHALILSYCCFYVDGDCFDGASRAVWCASGYSGSPQPIHCINTTWSSFSGCQQNSCSSPEVSEGYEVQDGDVSVGSSRVVLCAFGYSGSPQSIYCQLGVTTGIAYWSSLSGCSFGCPSDPSEFLRSGYELQPGDVSFGSYRTVICSAGFYGSPSTIVCKNSGSWSECCSSGCDPIPDLTSLSTTAGLLRLLFLLLLLIFIFDYHYSLE